MSKLIRHLAAWATSSLLSAAAQAQPAPAATPAPDLDRWQKVLAETSVHELYGFRTAGDVLQDIRKAPRAERPYFYVAASLVDLSRPEAGKRLPLAHAEKLRTLALEIYDYCHAHLYQAAAGRVDGACGGAMREGLYPKLLISGAWRRPAPTRDENLSAMKALLEDAARREPDKRYCTNWLDAVGTELSHMGKDPAAHAGQPEFIATARLLHEQLFAFGSACAARVPGYAGVAARQRYTVYVFAAFEERYPLRMNAAESAALLKQFDSLLSASSSAAQAGEAVGELAMLFVSLGLDGDAQRAAALSRHIDTELSRGLDAEPSRRTLLSCRDATGAFRKYALAYRKAAAAYPVLVELFDESCDEERLAPLRE